MNEILDNTDKKQGKHLFQKGVSGNPNGRPKGSISIKDKIRQHLEAHPEEVEEIVQHFVKENRELMWQMLEGRPDVKTDVTSGGETIKPILVEFLNGNRTEENRDTS